MIDTLLDMPIGPARGCGKYRNRQILAGIKPKMRQINAAPQAWENRAKKPGGNGEYTKRRIPFNILTEEVLSD